MLFKIRQSSTDHHRQHAASPESGGGHTEVEMCLHSRQTAEGKSWGAEQSEGAAEPPYYPPTVHT